MTDNRSDLDTFETALLHRLREEAGRRPEPADERSAPTSGSRRTHRQAWLVAAAGAAAVAGMVVQVPGWGPTPAFAVSGRNGSEVTVRVNRLEGADRLERALRERGIAADITYLPAGTECAAGRYAAVRTPGLVLGVARDWFEVTIPAGAVGPDDTFVLSASVLPSVDGFQATTDSGIANGTVAPCEVVDSP